MSISLCGTCLCMCLCGMCLWVFWYVPIDLGGIFLWACVVCDMSLCDMRLKACGLCAYEPVWYVPMSLCGMCLWACVVCAYEHVWYVPMSLCGTWRACVVWAHEKSMFGMCLGASVVEVSILRPGVASLSLCEAVRSSPQSYDVYNCWITTADMKKNIWLRGRGTNMEKGKKGESDESSRKTDNLVRMLYCVHLKERPQGLLQGE